MSRKRKILYWVYKAATGFTLLYLMLSLNQNANAAVKRPSNKTIPCDSFKNVVRVSTRKVTALSFLENPKDLVPGDGSFDFKRVQNDIFIKALSSSAKTNMFVFVGSKRCRFNLISSEQNVDDLLEVREPSENIMEVEFNEK